MIKKIIFIISLGLLTLSLSTAFPQKPHESNQIIFPKEGNENDKFRNNQLENIEEREEKHSMSNSNSARETNGRENLQGDHSKMGQFVKLAANKKSTFFLQLS